MGLDTEGVIPERFWKPVSDVVWSWPGRVVIGLGFLDYCYVSFGVDSTARFVGETAVVAAASWVFGQAWRRRPWRRRPA